MAYRGIGIYNRRTFRRRPIIFILRDDTRRAFVFAAFFLSPVGEQPGQRGAYEPITPAWPGWTSYESCVLHTDAYLASLITTYLCQFLLTAKILPVYFHWQTMILLFLSTAERILKFKVNVQNWEHSSFRFDRRIIFKWVRTACKWILTFLVSGFCPRRSACRNRAKVATSEGSG